MKSLATNKIGMYFHFDGQKACRFPQFCFQNKKLNFSINTFSKYIVGTHDVPSILDTEGAVLKNETGFLPSWILLFTAV